MASSSRRSGGRLEHGPDAAHASAGGCFLDDAEAAQRGSALHVRAAADLLAVPLPVGIADRVDADGLAVPNAPSAPSASAWDAGTWRWVTGQSRSICSLGIRSTSASSPCLSLAGWLKSNRSRSGVMLLPRCTTWSPSTSRSARYRRCVAVCSWVVASDRSASPPLNSPAAAVRERSFCAAISTAKRSRQPSCTAVAVRAASSTLSSGGNPYVSNKVNTASPVNPASRVSCPNSRMPRASVRRNSSSSRPSRSVISACWPASSG